MTASDGSGASDDVARAKALYFGCCCNARALVDDSANGSFFRRVTDGTSLPQAWREEYVAAAIGELGADSEETHHEAAQRLHFAGAIEALPALIHSSGRGDSFVRAMYASTLWDLVKWSRGKVAPEVRADASRVAKLLWEDVAREPVRLTEASVRRVDAEAMRWFGASTPQAYVQRYALSGLDRDRRDRASRLKVWLFWGAIAAIALWRWITR